MEVGAAIAVRDGGQGELGAESDSLAKPWPEGMTRQERGKEVGGAKFGTW